jgi:hypothetical protein
MGPAHVRYRMAAFPGTDLSLAMLEQHDGAHDKLLMDMGQPLPFRPGVFDAAYSISALHYLCRGDPEVPAGLPWIPHAGLVLSVLFFHKACSAQWRKCVPRAVRCCMIADIDQTAARLPGHPAGQPARDP